MILNWYASQHIQSIDFRNCLFTFNDVSPIIMEWPNLVSVNEGEFTVKWNKHKFA